MPISRWKVRSQHGPDRHPAPRRQHRSPRPRGPLRGARLQFVRFQLGADMRQPRLPSRPKEVRGLSVDLIAVGGLVIVLGPPAIGLLLGSLTAALAGAVILAVVAIAYLLRRVTRLSSTNRTLRTIYDAALRESWVEYLGLATRLAYSRAVTEAHTQLSIHYFELASAVGELRISLRRSVRRSLRPPKRSPRPPRTSLPKTPFPSTRPIRPASAFRPPILNVAAR
jgi:hypothetical protein